MKIKRDGASVEVILEVNGCSGVMFPFTFTCPSEWTAQLLHNAILDNYWSNQNRIERQAYLDGYRDGRGHRSKRYE